MFSNLVQRDPRTVDPTGTLPATNWDIILEKPFGFFTARTFSREFKANLFLYTAKPNSWYLVTLYSDDVETAKLLGSVGYYGIKKRSAWSDIGLVKTSEYGTGFFKLPSDGPVDPLYGPLLAEKVVFPRGEYKAIEISVKYINTDSEPTWWASYPNSCVYLGGYNPSVNPIAVTNLNLYHQDLISFTIN
jgi:hypothetical protein